MKMNISHHIQGIEIVFDNVQQLSNFLCFHDINFDNAAFSIIDGFATFKNRIVQIQPSCLTAEEMRDFALSGVVIEWMHLQLLPRGKTIHPIKSFGDFARSDCEMILSVHDCFFLEIYCKNSALIHVLLHNARKENAVIKSIVWDSSPCSENRSFFT